MSKNLSEILKKVFLSSLAGITSSNAAEMDNNVIEFIKEDDTIEFSFKKEIDLTPKLILKISNNQLSFMAHRSHRSHQSHRSHYSSSSGRTTPPPRPSSTPNENSGIQPNYINRPNLLSTAERLGSRTLKLGMSGTDVTELINILIKKKYLMLDDGSTSVTGIYTYDIVVEGAVRRFQADKGLTPDGTCGVTTYYYLKQ